MDIQLNFLQFQPQKNWLDYFINREEIYALLDHPKDYAYLFNLCDQFIEQALVTERELAQQLDKKQLDQEDIICMKHKSEDLWMCAISCFAASNWNLDLLNKNSNVIRIAALMDRLTRWVFEEENDQPLLDDPFSFICATQHLPKFSPTNTFVPWLYARWILSIDLESRFPSIPAKPTVSNPYQYVDQNLIQAEKLAQTTMEVQRKEPNAVRLLAHFIESREYASAGVDVPAKECFYPKLATITQESSLTLLSNFPKANFEAGKWTLDWTVFELRTLYDVMVAHFTARHISKSKEILTKIQACSNQLNPSHSSSDLQTCFLPKADQIAAYSKALSPSNSASFNSFSSREADPIMQLAKHRPKQQKIPANLIIKLLATGICRIPKFYRETELRVGSVQLDLIQNFLDELTLLGRNKASSKQRTRLLGSLYFLCSHCNGFADSLSRSAFTVDGFRSRPFANLSTQSVPQVPSEEQMQESSTSENAIWNILTSFDIEILRSSFARINGQIQIEGKRMVFSPISADPILNATKTAEDNKIFGRNQVMLWKLEQLARLGNREKWMAFLNKFSEDCTSISENADLLVYDTIRIQLARWNSIFYRSGDPNEFSVAQSTELKNLLVGTLARAIEEGKSTFQAFSKDLACYLLNNREWLLVNERIKNQPLFTTPFTNVAVLFSFLFTKLFIEKKRGEAFKTTQEIIWKVISPTFDAQKTGQPNRESMLSKDQLMELLEGIKEIEALSILIGLVSFLYNFAILSDQKPLNISVNASFDANVSTLSAVVAAMDTSSTVPITGCDPIKQQQNAGMQLLRNVGRNIYLDNAELWKPIKMDVYNNYDVDIPYIERVLELLCRQSKMVAPIYIPWLRFRADYAFVQERYNEAAKLYLETILAIERGILGKPGVVEEDHEWARKFIERMRRDIDSLLGKLAVSLYFLRMPTLASIVGQVRRDINPHLDMVNLLLSNTPATVDSGPAYFPLIADIHLMERMAATYEHPSLNLPLYRENLLKLMPTRAINVNNSCEVLERECEKRKERFMEILYKQLFGENIGRK